MSDIKRTTSFEQLVASIDDMIGWTQITSQRTIRYLDPPQAQRHCLLRVNGVQKRYLVSLLPIDMESLEESSAQSKNIAGNIDSAEQQLREGLGGDQPIVIDSDERDGRNQSGGRTQ